MPKVLLIGDSLRMGYQRRVRELLGDAAVVEAPEENCGHSMWIRERLDEWAIEPDPDLIHFNAGIWDLGWMPGETVPRFTVAAYARNLKLIVERLQRETRAELIFATTTPVLRPLRSDVPNERCEVAPIVARYNAAARKVMDAHDVPVNDLYGAVMQAGVTDCLSADKIHMSPEGSEVLARAVAEAIRRRL